MYIRRLRDLREDHDLTQASLCKKLNISQRTYSHYEKGERQVPVEILIELSRIYGTSVDYILGQTDEKGRYDGTLYSSQHL